MTDPVEERLQDLERLVLKQVERIDAFEEELETMRHVARWAMRSGLTKTEAA